MAHGGLAAPDGLPRVLTARGDSVQSVKRTAFAGFRKRCAGSPASAPGTALAARAQNMVRSADDPCPASFAPGSAPPRRAGRGSRVRPSPAHLAGAGRASRTPGRDPVGFGRARRCPAPRPSRRLPDRGGRQRACGVRGGAPHRLEPEPPSGAGVGQPDPQHPPRRDAVHGHGRRLRRTLASASKARSTIRSSTRSCARASMPRSSFGAR